MLRNLGIVFVVLCTSQLLVIVTAASNKPVCEDEAVKFQKLAAGAPFQCQPLPSSNDRDDYKLQPGVGYHKLHTEALSWNEARKKCIEEGAHLAIVNDKKEAEELGKLFNSSYEKIGEDANNKNLAWLGVHDQFEEGDYVTVLGDSFNAADDVWEKGYVGNHAARIEPPLCKPDLNQRNGFGRQPDNGNEEGSNQDCAALIRKCNTVDDNNCALKYAFFCEKPLCS